MSHPFSSSRWLSPTLTALVSLVSGTALAQSTANEPPTSAPTAPEPAEPTPPTPSAAAPEAPRPSEPAAPEPTPPRNGKHEKHKKRDASDREASPHDREGMLEAASEKAADDDLVFTSIGGSLKINGRLFVMAELSHRRESVVNRGGVPEERDLNALDLSLESARLGVEYHSPLRWLSAELEADFAGKPTVKDAFILAGKRLFVKAGQFKVPTAALELDSPWALPLARRGLVHDLLTDWLDVGGRRPGVALGYRGKGGLKPRLTIGAFQGTTLEQVAPGDRDVELIDHAALDAQSLAARGELTVTGVTIGAWYEHRVGSTEALRFEHYSTFGLDARLDHAFASGGLRLWLDGGAGESLYVADDKPGDDPTPLFVTARALVGYRFGGLALGAPYIEPFGHFALLDPDTEVVSDFVTEAAFGVNAGFWDRARLTLQGEMTSGQRNMPTGFLGHREPDQRSLLLQAGARF